MRTCSNRADTDYRFLIQVRQYMILIVKKLFKYILCIAFANRVYVLQFKIVIICSYCFRHFNMRPDPAVASMRNCCFARK